MNPLKQALYDKALQFVRRSRKANSDVRIDYSNWSQEARSSPIAFLDEFYSHAPYKCLACGKSCVFSAEDQKHVREVLKKRLEWHPWLCDGCHAIRVGLERERDAFDAAWHARRSDVRKSNNDLARWLEVLETLRRYRHKQDSAKIQQLRKLLHSNRRAG